MATHPTSLSQLISIEEYLNTTYRPDVDYVDGEIEERNPGEFEHGRVQGFLVTWLTTHEVEWHIQVLPEQRVRVTTARVRIPDVCVLSATLPRERIISHPPLLRVEVLPLRLRSGSE